MKILNLSNRGLNELHTISGEFEIIYLDNNKLTHFPQELCTHTQLQRLYLDNNKLTSLPPEIGKLTQLQELYLDNNQLDTLPVDIEELSALRYLSVLNNKNMDERLIDQLTARGVIVSI